ncbi:MULTISPECIES: hypothetical protein [unclassified Paenibacillus]|uniref:hypothetical protein n=1 Tax=unclassified Paenibacillus TaxID=185978 RepID=UPI001F1FEEE8|nr:hypothetical protein [Paenibacillus sp. JJ-223]CAH1214783.1 hypothetical protein PAECIP111890_04139 [Paenibacillus sp. JJ-223]
MDYANVTYTLESNGIKYQNEDMNASLFDELITNLDLMDYLVLVPSQPIDKSIYLQAATTDNPEEFVVEVRFVFDDERFEHYSYISEDPRKVIAIFLDYWGQQKLPNLGDWQDITEQFLT